MPPVKKIKYMCVECGKEYSAQDRNFRSSKSKMFSSNNYRLNICNSCIDKQYDEFIKIFDGNCEKAIKIICQRYDIYYDKEIAINLRTVAKDKSCVGYYIRQMNLGQYKDKTYTDYIKERVLLGEVNDLEETDGLTEEDKEIISESKRIFGVVKSQKDAKILKYYYDDWMTKTSATSITQENIIKNICWNLLNIQKARELGNDTNELEKELRNNITFGGWKPDTKNEGLSKDTFGTWIKKYEMKKPVEEDVDKSLLKELIEVYFLGHLAKSVGIKNMYSEKYENHIKKYTVKKSDTLSDKKKDVSKKLFGK